MSDNCFSFSAKDLLSKIAELEISAGLNFDLSDRLKQFGQNLKEQSINDLTNRIMNYDIKDIGSISSILAGFLGTIDNGYLGLFSFFSYLLRNNLKERIVLYDIFVSNLQSSKNLVNLIISLLDGISGEDYQADLERAYKSIEEAYDRVGYAKSRLDNSRSYNPSYTDIAEEELGRARGYLETPMIDTAMELSENAVKEILARNKKTLKTIIEKNNIGKSDINFNVVNSEMFAADENILEDSEDFEQYRAEMRTTWGEQRDVLMEGLSEIIDYDFKSASLASIESVKSLFQNLMKYFPLLPIGLDPEIDFLPTKEATLNSSNALIELKITNLAKIESIWEGLQLNSDLTKEQLNSIFNDIGELKEEVDVYAAGSDDAFKKFKGRVDAGTKFVVWKKKIQSIQAALKSIEGFEQAAAQTSTAYEQLEEVLDELKSISAEYGNDDDTTPRSELAYEQIDEMLQSMLLSGTQVFRKNFFVKLRQQINESIYTLKEARGEDQILMSKLTNFISSVASIDGIEIAISKINELLDSTNYNSTLGGIIDFIREGHLLDWITLIETGVGKLIGGFERATKLYNEVVLPAKNNIQSSYKECFNIDSDTEDKAKEFEKKNAEARGNELKEKLSKAKSGGQEDPPNYNEASRNSREEINSKMENGLKEML